MSARQQMVDKAEAAATRGNHQLAELLRMRVRMWDRTDGAWDLMDLELPARADGAAERCECDAATQLCSCEPLRTDSAEPEIELHGGLRVPFSGSLTFTGTDAQLERAKQSVAARTDATATVIKSVIDLEKPGLQSHQRTDPTHSMKRTDMSDPAEEARLERDARNKRAAFAGADSSRQDSEREEREAEKAAQARRAAARSASLDIALKRQQQNRVDANQAREAIIAERRAACAPTTTAPTVPDSVREELAEEARRERLRRDAMGSRMLREQAERNR